MLLNLAKWIPRSTLMMGLLLPATGAAEEDEFDFLEDEDDELIIAPGDGDTKRNAVIDLGDEDPDWDMDSPSSDLPEEGIDDPDWDMDSPPDELPEIDSEDPSEDFDEPEDDLMMPEEEQSVDIRGRKEDRGIMLETEGKRPLAGNYPLQILSKDLDAIVVELPILVAQARSDFQADFWITAEVRVNGNQIGESRQLVNAASLSDLAASFAWIKMFVPVAEAQGTVEFVVKRLDAESEESETLFSVSSAYQL